jgi:hypothetical protein
VSGVENSGKQLGGATGKGFVPGQSGNPGGRPKGSVKLRELLEPHLEATVARVVLAAQAGEQWALLEILNRVAGRPTVGEPDDDEGRQSAIFQIITGIQRGEG